MGKSVPEAPNYAAAAQQQGQSSRNAINAQTAANRPNQNTPFGSQTWSSEEIFNEDAYNRAMEDWQRQYGGSGGGGLGGLFGGGGMSDEGRAMMPTRNDFYTTNWTQNTQLDPNLQGALDSQIDLQRSRSDLANSLFPRAQQEFGQAMDWSGFNPFQNAPDVPQYGQGLPGVNYGPNASQYSPEQIQRGVQTQNLQRDLGVNNQYSPEQIQRDLDTTGLQDIDPSQRYAQSAEDAIYGQWSNRQEPRMQQQADQMATRLRNQGLRPGDQAYDQAMQRMTQDQDDARLMAQYQATIGSGAEAQRMFGMDMGARQQQFGERSQQGQFANQASQQALNQQLGIGGQRFNEALDAGQFYNQAGMDLFGQNLSAGQFGNQASQQALNQQLGIGGQRFNEALGQGQFYNQAGMDLFGQNLAAGQFGNQASQQALEQQFGIGDRNFAQGQQQAAMNNAIRSQLMGEQLAAGGQQFQQGMQAAGMNNTIRQQQIAEEMQRRGFSLNEINAIISGQQVGMPSMPGFSNAGAAQGINYSGAAQNQYSAALDAANARNMGMANLWGGLTGMGSSFLGGGLS